MRLVRDVHAGLHGRAGRGVHAAVLPELRSGGGPMSVRELRAQYLGDTLRVFGVERDVRKVELYEGPYPSDGARCYVPERTCEMSERCRELMDESAELREQMGRLVRLLRDEHGIDASWDGLRGFWTVQLTDAGCAMRDRAEAENAKLRELVRIAFRCQNGWCDGCPMETRHQTSNGGTPGCIFEAEAIKLGIEEDG